MSTRKGRGKPQGLEPAPVQQPTIVPQDNTPSVAAQSLPAPDTTDNGALRAKLVQQYGFPVSAAANLPQTRLDDYARQIAAGTFQVATSAPAGVSSDLVQPISAAPEYTPMTGFQTKVGEGFFATPKEITDELGKNTIYQGWSKMQQYARPFNNTAKAIEAIPDAVQKKINMNSLDMSLGESIIKLYDPEGAIREFKWDKVAEMRPVINKLGNLRAEALKTGSLDPETRKNLIELGYETIAGRESAIRPVVNLAIARATDKKLDLQKMFTSDDFRVASGVHFQSIPADKTTSAAFSGGASVNTQKPNSITLPKGRVLDINW